MRHRTPGYRFVDQDAATVPGSAEFTPDDALTGAPGDSARRPVFAAAPIAICVALTMAFAGVALLAAWDTPHRTSVASVIVLGYAMTIVVAWRSLRRSPIARKRAGTDCGNVEDSPLR